MGSFQNNVFKGHGSLTTNTYCQHTENKSISTNQEEMVDMINEEIYG